MCISSKTFGPVVKVWCLEWAHSITLSSSAWKEDWNWASFCHVIIMYWEMGRQTTAKDQKLAEQTHGWTNWVGRTTGLCPNQQSEVTIPQKNGGEGKGEKATQPQNDFLQSTRQIPRDMLAFCRTRSPLAATNNDTCKTEAQNLPPYQTTNLKLSLKLLS